MHIKFISYQKKKHWIAHHLKSSCSPPSHTGESCSRDKGQMPQLSPRGTLELAGAFCCSLVFFFFLTASCTHSFWMTGRSPERTKLSLALGLFTRHLLPLPRTPPEPQPTSFQVLASVSCWEEQASLAVGLSCVLPRRLCLSCLECIILRWSASSCVLLQLKAVSSFSRAGGRVFYLP